MSHLNQSLCELSPKTLKGCGAHLVKHLALAIAKLVEEGLVRGALLHCVPDLVKVLCAGQLVVPMRVQQAEVAVQLAPVIPGQLCADGVQCDVQRPSVSLCTIHLLQGLQMQW